MCMVDIRETITYRFSDCGVACKAWDFSLEASTQGKLGRDKRGHGNHWIGNMGSLVRKFLPHLVHILEFGFYLEASDFGLFE